MKTVIKNAMKSYGGALRGALSALFAVGVIFAVCGNDTVVSDNRSGGQGQYETTGGSNNVFKNIDLANSGRFVSVVGYLARISEKGLKNVAESFYREAMELALKNADGMEGALDLWKDNLEDSRRMGKLKKGLDNLGLAITIADGILKIRNAKTEEERINESCRLALHLFSSALGSLTKKQIGDLISDLGDHALDHPEDNGFAIIVNWIYDNSSLPEKLNELWYDMKYKGKILQERDDKKIDYEQHYEFIPSDELSQYDDDTVSEDPFDSMPESNQGSFGDDYSGSRYQGLKPLHLID